MKLLPASLLILLASLAGAVAAKDPAPDARADTIAELAALVTDFVENSDKLDRHQRFWAEDLVYTSSGADVKDKASILRSFDDAPTAASDKPAAPSPRFSAEDILVRPYGEAAAVTFRLVATMPDGKRAYYRNSGMFLRREGRWQAVTWQATKVPEPAADTKADAGK
jgi:hypothetical protein